MTFLHRCDLCGKLISICSFMHGASKTLLVPKTPYHGDVYETICIKCNEESAKEIERINLMTEEGSKHVEVDKITE